MSWDLKNKKEVAMQRLEEWTFKGDRIASTKAELMKHRPLNNTQPRVPSLLQHSLSEISGISIWCFADSY